MRKAQRVKLRKFGYSAMLVAAFAMAVPVNAMAGVVEGLNGQQVQLHPAVETQNERCTGVFFGGLTTENGDTYIGRSEDLNGNNRKDFEYVKAADHDPEKDFYVNFDSAPNFEWAMPEHTLGYTSMHDDPYAWFDMSDAGEAEFGMKNRIFAANGINEKGVAITATTTISQNDKSAKVDPYRGDMLKLDENGEKIPELGSDGKQLHYRDGSPVWKMMNDGLAEDVLGDILLGQATSPKNACEVAGNIIDKVGTNEGYQFYAGNTEEAWIFSTLSGHEWIAFKIPNDVLMVNPNVGGLRYKIDPNSDDVIHSKNLFETAKKVGEVKFDGDMLDVFATFGQYDCQPGSRGYSRLWQGYRYLTGNDATADKLLEDHPLFFKPTGDKKFSTMDVLRSLGTNGEGTKVDSTDKITWKKGVPARAIYENGFYPIGNLNQLQCHVFQLRNDTTLPEAIRTVQWQCMGSARYGVYIPVYSALIDTMPEDYAIGSNDHAGEGCLVETEEANKSMYWTMTDLSKLAGYAENKGADMTKLREKVTALQNEFIEIQKQHETALKSAPEAERTAMANKFLAEDTTKLHDAALELNKYLRSYIAYNDVMENYDTMPFELKTYEFEAKEYKTIDGAQQEYVVDAEKGATFRFDAEFKVFENGGKVYVDGKLVAPENYVAKAGSTIIEFTPEFMNSLSKTAHTLKVVFGDNNEVTTSFNVVEKSEPAKKDPIENPEKTDPEKTDPKKTDPKKTEPKKDNGKNKLVPKTGDSTNMLFPVVIAIAGAGVVYVGAKKREEI